MSKFSFLGMERTKFYFFIVSQNLGKLDGSLQCLVRIEFFELQLYLSCARFMLSHSNRFIFLDISQLHIRLCSTSLYIFKTVFKA